MELYLAALLGAIGYLLIDFAGKKGMEVFSKKYLAATIVNILMGALLIWGTELKEGVMQIGWFDASRILAMAFGVGGQKIFKAIIDATDKNVKTKLGINKKK